MRMEHWWKDDRWQENQLDKSLFQCHFFPTHCSRPLFRWDRLFKYTRLHIFHKNWVFFLHSSDSGWHNVCFEKGRDLTYSARTNRNSSNVFAQSTTRPNNKRLPTDRTIFCRRVYVFWKTGWSRAISAGFICTSHSGSQGLFLALFCVLRCKVIISQPL
jgi:hypothetical protein